MFELIRSYIPLDKRWSNIYLSHLSISRLTFELLLIIYIIPLTED